MADRIDLPLPERFAGVLVVGDVHGHPARLDPFLAFAREHRLFALSVGDLVDRGPDSVGCLARFRALEAAGDGLWLRGNHEDKVFRALIGRPVKRTEAIERTLGEFATDEGGEGLRHWFLDAYPKAPYVVRFRNVVVAHGGFARRMLEGKGTFAPSLKARALYGQPGRQLKADGKPVRLYNWVEEIPGGVTVVIGHDPISRETLLTRANRGGGRMIHLDSNAAKGGSLSALHLDREGGIEAALQVESDGADPRPVAFAPVTPEAFPHAIADAPA
ncbi:MAG: metallophosphoesterase [Geminicoccaceae bacterium]|nr:metallophosphoesterase [Geminicoccaceae bacterium]